MNLDSIPAGSRCFVDANILAYHIVQTPPFTAQVANFINRVAVGELIAFTTSIAISEALHRIMLAEVMQLFAPTGRILSYVQNHPQIIAQLPIYLVAAQRISNLGVQLAVVDNHVWRVASGVAAAERLLTNDACIVAVMNVLGIEYLATNDHDFDQVASIKICTPQ